MNNISKLEGLNYGTMGLIEFAIQSWLEKGDNEALEEAEGRCGTVIEELHDLSASALFKEDCSAASALLDAIARKAKEVLEKIGNEEIKTHLQEIHKIAAQLSSRVEGLFREHLEREMLKIR